MAFPFLIRISLTIHGRTISECVNSSIEIWIINTQGMYLSTTNNGYDSIHDDDTLRKRNNNACFRCMVVLVVNTVFSLLTIQFAH